MQMRRSWQARIDDMVGAIGEIEAFVAGMDYERFLADAKTQKAVAANLYIVGETASRLAKDLVSHHTAVPWDRLRRMRKPIANGRFTLDTKVLWQTVHGELPDVAPSVRALASSPHEDELHPLD